MNSKEEPIDLHNPILKVFGIVMTTYITMTAVLKLFTPILYGAVATHAAIFKVEAVGMMPSFMMLTGFLALRVKTEPFKTLWLLSLVGSLGVSCVMAIGLPYI